MQKLFTKSFLSVWSNAEVMKCTKFTTQKRKFSIKDFFRIRIWSHLLKKSLTENFIFCAVIWTILRWFVWALSNCAQTNFKKMQFIWIMLYTILLWHSTFREPLVYNISHHTRWALNVNRLGGFRIPECWVLPFYRKSINFFTFYARTANKKRYASTILRIHGTLQARKR